MVPVLVWVTAFFLFLAIMRQWFRKKMHLEQRVMDIRARNALPQQVKDPLDLDGQKRRFSTFGSNIAKNVVSDLENAGIFLSRQEWMVVWSILLALLSLSYAITRSVIPPVLLVIVVGVGYKTLIQWRKHIRLKKFEEGLMEALITITGSLRTGYSFFQSIESVARESKGIVSEEFKKMIKEISLGVSVEDAMIHASERVQSQDLELVLNVVMIQRQVGGNLAEVLEISTETIRSRLRMKGEIRALTAQGRMSMWIFLLLTPAIALAMLLFNSSYLSVLWSTKTGWIMVIIAALGQSVGAVLIRRIVRMDV